jgi:poly(A)-specific ribonuclease
LIEHSASQVVVCKLSASTHILINLDTIAVQFLLKSGFDLNAPFHEGVSYLSTKEEEQVLEDAHRHNSGRLNTGTVAQIVLSKGDAESVAFLADVRKDIEEWLNVGEVSS